MNSIMLLLENLGYSKKYTSIRYGMPPLELLVRDPPEPYKHKL